MHAERGRRGMRWAAAAGALLAPARWGAAAPPANCSVCLTGDCSDCRACVGVKSGFCEPCWSPDPARGGVQCLFPGGGRCQKCWDENRKSCRPPKWEQGWSLASSLYMYCYLPCPVRWMAEHKEHGVFAGVVGYDHIFTRCGTPCVGGEPREFEMQDDIAVWTKAQFPKARVLQYRITDAVPYAGVVHERMLSDPADFVRYANGTMCQMPPNQHCAYANTSCPFAINRAAAFDWRQASVQKWYVDNVVKPTLRVADGAWIDGDGPGNGAWACTDGRSTEPVRSALSPAEAQAFREGEGTVMATAQAWLIENGGYDYNCFSFVAQPDVLPVAGDPAAACAAKLYYLASSALCDCDPWDKDSPAVPTSGSLDALNCSAICPNPAARNQVRRINAKVLYGDRNRARLYDDSNVTEAAAVLMLVRGRHWLLGMPRGTPAAPGSLDSNLTGATAAALLRDDGAPLGNMTEARPGVFQREYERATVQLDCGSFTARWL